jgi:hypothetical protein
MIAAMGTPVLQSSFIPSPRENAVHSSLDLGTVLDRVVDQPLLHAVPKRLHRRVLTRERRKFQTQQPRHLLVSGFRQRLQTVDLLCSDNAALWRCGLWTLHQRAQLRHCDEESDGDLPQQLQHLKRQVRRAEFRRNEKRVNHSAESCRELRSGHDVEFDGEQSGHDHVAPEFAGLEVTQHAEEDEGCAGADVVSADVLHAGEDIVTDGLHLSPLQDLRTEAVVGEAFRWVD